MSIIGLQRRQRELGRIRMGEKGPKGQPVKLSHFRLTSPAKHLLEEAARLWGGEVREWKDAPAEGNWELYTQTDVLPIVIPPGPEPVSQFYEQWTGGGATHRCDGVTNYIDDSPCSCNPEARACKATTRVSLMLPDLPDIGVWRLETHGINAAYELPGTIDVIQAASSTGRFLSGRLRIEHRTSKKAGQTRKFIVPVIDLDLGVKQLMNGEAPEREALPAGEVREIEAPASAPEPPAVIDETQRRKLFAKGKGLTPERIKEIVLDLTGQDSTKAITLAQFDTVLATVENFAKEEAAAPVSQGQGVLEKLKQRHEDPA